MTGDARLVRRVELVIRLGVVASVALVLFGMALCFARHPSYFFSVEEMAILKNPGGAKVSGARVLLAALGLRGQDLVLSGLMILMITPIAGVVTALLSFAASRRWAHVLIGSAVLALLLLSALLGRASG